MGRYGWTISKSSCYITGERNKKRRSATIVLVALRRSFDPCVAVYFFAMGRILMFRKLTRLP